MITKYDEDKLNSLVENFRYARFRHNGRSLEEGLDCLGFLILVYKEFGIDLPSGDGFDVKSNWYRYDPERYLRGLQSLDGESVPFESLQTLDLVYFAINRGVVTHTGIMINSNEFAHVMLTRGFKISSIHGYWKVKFRGGIRLVT
ncbi:NLP/P60 protein [Alkaliphilus metalliredigens QYMF]|uniref:NLP/P60 protein n=1 Tax=Alkaliphilus metalliredigens (strain QYMF) TaxID=293826 RepID=A6TL11_ALKMQ|nr:NlpC/P60 family protein [Alkaliphilus metalliredigens]ABR46879.1 NLP/P60 protein [Alkaliphilus metalliredigens QYMF]